MTGTLPTLTEAKALAKALRDALAAEGVRIGHSQALEKVAHRHGFRDWNALHAAICDQRPQGWTAGQRVSGYYLSHRFVATVVWAKPSAPGWFHVALDFDEAVDVIRFEGLTNYRKRIRAELGPDGRSRAATSDGRPHVELDR